MAFTQCYRQMKLCPQGGCDCDAKTTDEDIMSMITETVHEEDSSHAWYLRYQRVRVERNELRDLLKRAYSTIKHGAATSIAHAQILSDIEKAVGLKSEAKLLKQAFSS